MELMNNREGYHDPTARRAIQNVARRTRRGKDEAPRPLTYRLGEIRNIQEWVDLSRN